MESDLDQNSGSTPSSHLTEPSTRLLQVQLPPLKLGQEQVSRVVVMIKYDNVIKKHPTLLSAWPPVRVQ